MTRDLNSTVEVKVTGLVETQDIMNFTDSYKIDIFDSQTGKAKDKNQLRKEAIKRFEFEQGSRIPCGFRARAYLENINSSYPQTVLAYEFCEFEEIEVNDNPENLKPRY